MTINDKKPVAAIVVGFLPDFPILDTLLLTLLDQAGCVIFVDNGGGGCYLADYPQKRKQVHYIDLHGNQGLGYALNAGFQEAVSRKFEFVATFDQDSSPPASMLAGLLAAHRNLAGMGVECAAVGPRFHDSREGTLRKFPVYKQVGRSSPCSVPLPHRAGRKWSLVKEMTELQVGCCSRL